MGKMHAEKSIGHPLTDDRDDGVIAPALSL